MSDNDALKRAKQALEVSPSRRTDLASPLPDQSKINDLLARAREAAAYRPLPSPAPPEPPKIEERPRPQQAAPPPKVAASAGPPQVRLQMVCSARGDSFIGIAEREDSKVRLISHELLRGSGHGGAASTELLSGQYTLAGTDWSCPICGTRPKSLWTCPCGAQYAGVLHCGGFAGRSQYCACGRLEQREGHTVSSLALRGSSVVTVSSNAEPALPALHTPLARGGVPAASRKR
jgi:hypothetical protein